MNPGCQSGPIQLKTWSGMCDVIRIDLHFAKLNRAAKVIQLLVRTGSSLYHRWLIGEMGGLATSPRFSLRVGWGRNVGVVLASILLLSGSLLHAEIEVSTATLFLDFATETGELKILHDARMVEGKFGRALEFKNSLQYAEIEFSGKLSGVQAISVGGWFFPRRSGEQSFVFRGIPESGPQGERMFRRAEDWVNFVLGTD
jgi:hypothetical protein